MLRDGITFGNAKLVPYMGKIVWIGGLLWLATLGNAEADGLGVDPQKLVDSARSQIGITNGYDLSYRSLSYPGGDLDASTGVCTDVLIRALREQGIDLQLWVHEDMRASFHSYPNRWGLNKPDKNIDHRRVPNLMTFFDRQGTSLASSTNSGDYRPGDLVVWDLGGGILHIGIVSDRRSERETPLILHNISAGAMEEDILFEYQIIGHYGLTRLQE